MIHYYSTSAAQISHSNDVFLKNCYCILTCQLNFCGLLVDLNYCWKSKQSRVQQNRCTKYIPPMKGTSRVSELVANMT